VDDGFKMVSMIARLQDTIAAIATPAGFGGIAIIKLSGPESIACLEGLFHPVHVGEQHGDAADFQRPVYGRIIDPAQELVVDEVLVSIMKAPRTYTRQDVVEINCHGGPVVTRRIFEMILERGVRSAEPGEFTCRAFLNGRINLTQAEAVIDLIQAKSFKAAQAGVHILQDGLGDYIRKIKDQLLNIYTEVEAEIDFEDDLEAPLPLDIHGRHIRRGLVPDIDRLIRQYRESRLLREGLQVVVAGRPNVGKSSLMNRILNQERVIVASTPGTTRDAVQAFVDIEGIPVALTDTAGIQEGTDPVEAVGIQMAWKAVDTADLVLFVLDASQPINLADMALYHKISGKAHIVLRNKVDLLKRPPTFKLEGGGAACYLDISAKRGDGIEALKQEILKQAGLIEGSADLQWGPNLRQRRLLEAARQAMIAAAPLLENEADHEVAALEIKEALHALDQILGENVGVDVLEKIFSRFCIGK
jgi:tRNA modification GTPase